VFSERLNEKKKKEENSAMKLKVLRCSLLCVHTHI